MARHARRSSDWRPVIVVALLALTVLCVSAYVGEYQSREHGFDWELAAILGTALGTTLLAAATGWLAWSTRTEVRATQELAELTRSQQTASDRPVVLQASAAWGGTPSEGSLWVELQNVGVGPALRVRVGASYVGHSDWQPTITSTIIPSIASQSGRMIQLPVTFPEPHDRPGGVDQDGFRVAGDYLDRSLLNTYPIITDWPEA